MSFSPLLNPNRRTWRVDSKAAFALAAGVGPLGLAVRADARPTWPKPEIPIERFYQFPLINGRSPSGAAMSPDGSKIVFGWNETGKRKLDLWVMSYPDGLRKQIVRAEDILDLPRQDDSRSELDKTESALYDGGIGGAQWSPDGEELMFSYKGRNWLVKPDGTRLRPLVDGSSAVYNPKYSLDGKYIHYSNGTNIFRMSRSNGLVKQLTFVSRPGTSIDGFEVSPNGEIIAVQWSDSTKGGSHVMMDFSKDRATVVNIGRMWNGDESIDTQVGFVSGEGGLIKFIKDLPRYNWLKGFEWSPDSKKFALAWIKEDFKEYTIAMVDPNKAEKTDIYKEKAPSNYINDWRDIVWSKDSKKLIFGTDIKDGKFIYRSIFQMNPDGKGIEPVYVKNHDVGAFARPRNSEHLVLSVASKSPLQAEIALLDEKKSARVISVIEGGYSVPKDFNNSTLPIYSEDGSKIATLASKRTLNSELYSVLPKVRRLTESQLPEFDKVKWANFEEVSFDGPDGKKIHGILITKPGVDKSKKYPAILSNMYADSAKANWAGYVENYAAMNLDMVVLCVDFRSSWGYGGEFNSGYYGRMGLIDSDEAVAAKKFLVSTGFVDKDRVGVWGWSYGGYLTCMIMLTKPDEFKAGVAVASVTDWKSYNEWYTRRRLGLVKDDPKVFEKTSPISYAAGLKGNLMLVHGMLDDNVLYQDTARLIQRLIDNGKHFDMLAYPRDDHGIGKDSSRPHVQASILRYLFEKLND